jgi:Cu+-exporting ATPase
MNRIRATAMIEETVKSEAVLRLKRIEGQIRGIQKMIEHDRSHNDIVIQLSAAEKAINSVSLIPLKGYVEMRVYDGLLAVADTLKDNSVAAVKKLESLGLNVIMLTGDNKKTAQAIAHTAGIKNVIPEVLPEDKVLEIKKLQAEGKKSLWLVMG